MSVKTSILILVTLFSFFSCQKRSSTEVDIDPLEKWLIPKEDVFESGLEKDGIPAIDNPQFTSAGQVSFLDDNRLVLGMHIGNEVRAYPHQILDWHEIVNDEAGDLQVSLTYCPLTGTGIAWERDVPEMENEFGVTGLIFKNNLLAYDRRTDTYWSQMQMRAVKGDLSGTRLPPLPIIETTWGTWKNMYPESMVLNTQTGYSRNYGGYAYGASYPTDNEDIRYPVTNLDRRLPSKTRVHAAILGDINGEQVDVRVYNIEEMSDSLRVINEQYEGEYLVAAGSAAQNFTVSYFRELEDGTRLEFEPVQDRLPVVMTDQEGNEWNIFGEAVSGPRLGTMLRSPASYNGYWFSIADFFPLSCVHPATDCKRVIDK